MNADHARTLLPALACDALEDAERDALLVFLESEPELRREADRLAVCFDRATLPESAPPAQVWEALAAELRAAPQVVTAGAPPRPATSFVAPAAEPAKPEAEAARPAAESVADRSADRLFAHIALQRRLVSRDLLNRAMHYTRTEAPASSLSQVLVDKGILSRHQAEEVEVYQRRIAALKASTPGVPPLPVHERDPLLGEVVAGCTINAKLGRSRSLGDAYLAHHQASGEDVVLKLLDAELAENPRVVERFFRDGRAVAKFEHPNVLESIDLGRTEGGVPYAIQRHVDGQTLEERLRSQGAFTPREALTIVLQVARALEAAHARGIVHRDVRADNLLVSPSGAVYLTDFGLAKDLNTELELTADGCMIGAPLYMAPEIGRVKQIDGRVDIYSLGLTFYTLLTGVQPLRAFSALEILSAKAHRRIAPPETHRPLPADYRTVLGRMLAVDRDHRYPNATALLQDLQALNAGVPLAAPPSPWLEQSAEPVETPCCPALWWVVAAALAAALVALGVFL